MVTTNKGEVVKATAAVKNGGQGLLGRCIFRSFDMTKSDPLFIKCLNHQQFGRRFLGLIFMRWVSVFYLSPQTETWESKFSRENGFGKKTKLN